jgi:hypothetical protein
LNTIEDLIGSSYDDSFIGSAANNTLIGGAGKDTMYGMLGTDILVSGSGNDAMLGGSGVDLLVADGATPAGAPRSLYGDGVNDGGARGGDVYRSLDGWNLIWDYQQGERIEVEGGLARATLGGLNGNWWLRLVTTPGETPAAIGSHETWAVIGSQASMTQTQAGTMASTYMSSVVPI